MATKAVEALQLCCHATPCLSVFGARLGTRHEYIAVRYVRVYETYGSYCTDLLLFPYESSATRCLIAKARVCRRDPGFRSMAESPCLRFDAILLSSTQPHRPRRSCDSSEPAPCRDAPARADPHWRSRPLRMLTRLVTPVPSLPAPSFLFCLGISLCDSLSLSLSLSLSFSFESVVSVCGSFVISRRVLVMLFRCFVISTLHSPCSYSLTRHRLPKYICTRRTLDGSVRRMVRQLRLGCLSLTDPIRPIAGRRHLRRPYTAMSTGPDDGTATGSRAG